MSPKFYFFVKIMSCYNYLSHLKLFDVYLKILPLLKEICIKTLSSINIFIYIVYKILDMFELL